MSERGAVPVSERYRWNAIARAMAVHYSDVLARDRGDHLA